MSISKFNKEVFNTSGSWTAPAGVTSVMVWGMGGGAGGEYGENGSVGGLSNCLVPVILDVVPNTSYTITIGAGGLGGTSTSSPEDSDAENTAFGALMIWSGAKISQGYSSSHSASSYWHSQRLFNSGGFSDPDNISSGTNNQGNGYPGKLHAGGAAGTDGGTSDSHGGGGGFSGEAVGGNGGDGNSSGVGQNGQDAPANSGAGGGGGGEGTSGGGNGGAGGSGQLIVMWVE